MSLQPFLLFFALSGVHLASYPAIESRPLNWYVCLDLLVQGPLRSILVGCRGKSRRGEEDFNFLLAAQAMDMVQIIFFCQSYLNPRYILPQQVDYT